MSGATETIDKVRIPALSSSNYATWSVLVRELLRRKGLLELISTETPDPEVATAAAVNRFTKNDMKTRSYLVLHLGPEAITNVTSLLSMDATTKHVWLKLKSTYQRDNMQARLTLETQLYALRFADMEDMEPHLQKFNKIFVDLATLGISMNNDYKVGHLLRSLPDSFHALVSIAGAMKWTCDELVDEVKANIDRRSRDKTVSTYQGKTKDEVRVTPGARKKRRIDNANIECYYGHKRGHMMRECRKRMRDRAQAFRGRSRWPW